MTAAHATMQGMAINVVSVHQNILFLIRANSIDVWQVKRQDHAVNFLTDECARYRRERDELDALNSRSSVVMFLRHSRSCISFLI